MINEDWMMEKLLKLGLIKDIRITSDKGVEVKLNIEKALSKLTDAQKYVIHLSYYEGYTQNEISEKLKIPLLTVKSKVKIALNNLKDNLIKEKE